MKKSLQMIIGSLLIACASLGLFHVKYRVQELKEEVKALEESLEFEKNALHVLKAEWAYLNKPERIQRLAKKYLGLDLVDNRRIFAKIDEKIFSPTSDYTEKVNSNIHLTKVEIENRNTKVRWNIKRDIGNK